MHYEEKWLDGWLWRRLSPHGQWSRVSSDEMMARMRHALALVLEATDCPEHRKNDVAWLRGALLAARGAALTALGPEPRYAANTVTRNPAPDANPRGGSPII